jgi:hypothetical protein
MLLNFDSTLAALTADIGFVMVDVRFAFAAPDKVLSRLRLLAAGDLLLGSLSSLLLYASHTGLTAVVKFNLVTRPMGACCLISSQHVLMSTRSMRITRVKSLSESCGRAFGSISPRPRTTGVRVQNTIVGGCLSFKYPTEIRTPSTSNGHVRVVCIHV